MTIYYSIRLVIGEEYVVYTSRGAYVSARSATRAFIVIDTREIVFYRNCADRTSLFALFATDAGIIASTARIGTLVLAVAHNNSLGFLGNERDNALGANGGAKSASDAKYGINVSDSVLYAYSVRGANRRAVTVSKASVLAGIGAAVKHCRRLTRGISLIIQYF